MRTKTDDYINLELDRTRRVVSNAKYFVSDEFQEFTMDWSIQHTTSSPRYPHGWDGMAEKAVGMVKEPYAKYNDIKLGLLLLKTTPVTGEHHLFQAPANVFFGRQLKAHLPIYLSKDTCTLDAENSANSYKCDPLSKYIEQQSVWVKLDKKLKWIDGEIIQVLPNQSYMVKLSDGRIF